MGLFQQGEDYLLSVGLKRAAFGLAGYIVGHLISGSVAATLQANGVSVDPAMVQNYLSGTIVAGVVWLHDYARTKTGWVWL